MTRKSNGTATLVVYVALAILNVSLKVLAVVIKFAFYAALVVGLLYLFS